ncbi:MAG: hypothetical protein B6I20_11040 [Bacteroidetes bacterium 4572_117]|nr:MAG: hypothetical protein B6I20_11040 [Bacteroidetes bacterium 4572_117]
MLKSFDFTNLRKLIREYYPNLKNSYMHLNIRRLTLLLITTVLLTQYVNAQKIYEWRGENRSGIYNEKNLLKSWPEQGPELIREYTGIGNGYGSPIFTDDRMYIQGELDSIGYLFAYDLKGELLWKKDYGKEWVESYRGSRSTPTIVDNLIYVCSGLGNITCFDSKNGKKIWFVDMLKDLNGSFTMFGHSESLLIDGDKVFLTAGGADTNVVALNRFDGKIIWVCKGLGERPGYNAPNIIRLENRNILLTFSAYSLMGIDTKTGDLLWTHVQDNLPVEKHKLGMGDTHSNTILYENRFIYYVAGDGNCAVKLKLSQDGKKITEVWRNKKFDSYMGGIVKIGNKIYSCGTAKKDLRRITADTGIVTDSLKLGSGAVILADGMLYYYSQNSKMCLVKPNPEKMELISSFKIKKGTKEHFAHPVINKGILYVRHGNIMLAYNIKQEQNNTNE